MNEDGTITITGSTTVVIGIEGIITGSGNDTLTGNSLSNLLGGGAGNDTISGLGGTMSCSAVTVTTRCSVVWATIASSVVPATTSLDENAPVDADGVPTYGPLGNGADALDGGPGIDTVDYGARTNSTVVYLGLISTFNDGADTNQDGLTNEFDDVFFTTENVVTGSGEDLVSANFTNNRANNVIKDNVGNDCVEGGPGNDQFQQGSAPQGADVILGNTGADWANYGVDNARLPGLQARRRVAPMPWRSRSTVSPTTVISRRTRVTWSAGSASAAARPRWSSTRRSGSSPICSVTTSS